MRGKQTKVACCALCFYFVVQPPLLVLWTCHFSVNLNSLAQIPSQLWQRSLSGEGGRSGDCHKMWQNVEVWRTSQKSGPNPPAGEKSGLWGQFLHFPIQTKSWHEEKLPLLWFNCCMPGHFWHLAWYNGFAHICLYFSGPFSGQTLTMPGWGPMKTYSLCKKRTKGINTKFIHARVLQSHI